MSIDTVGGNEGVEGALKNHQVLTGGAVHIVQSDRWKVCPKTALQEIATSLKDTCSAADFYHVYNQFPLNNS